MTLTFSKETKTAFLFPGQGAQVVGMGLDLFKNSKAAKNVFEEVDDALGKSLSKLIFEGPDDLLKNTVNAQPAIMSVSLACMAALKENAESNHIVPTVLAGHSLGEYTALAVAEVLSVKDTALLVQKRGELMQSACDTNPGTMAAILGLDEIILNEITRETGTYVSNVNTSEQIVISGSDIAVARALDMCSTRGAKKVIPLRVGGAFHSGLMEPAIKGLIDTIEGLDFQEPVVPIIANCTADSLFDSNEIKSELINQITGCVNWKKSVDFMIKSGINNFLEIGPGRALSGMVKRIDRSAEISSISDLESILHLSRN
jgi:[acyl-carrier-protein] S-malonyltransferase